MGFFGSLFEKRQCSICGKEMGLTERKELSSALSAERKWD